MITQHLVAKKIMKEGERLLKRHLEEGLGETVKWRKLDNVTKLKNAYFAANDKTKVLPRLVAVQRAGVTVQSKLKF